MTGTNQDSAEEAVQKPCNQFIYILQCDKYIKVGRANNVYRRAGEMVTGNPFDLDVLCYYKIKPEKITSIEKGAHRELEQYSHKGEWFSCSKEVAMMAVEYAIRTVFGEFDRKRVLMSGQEDQMNRTVMTMKTCKE